MRTLGYSKLPMLLLIASAVAVPRPSLAQTVTTYTSLQSWQAAVAGSWQFMQGFTTVTQDTYFQSSPVNFGPFSLQQVGQDTVFGLFENFIDVPPLQFTNNSGATNAALYVKSNLIKVNLTLNGKTYAWGANFYGAQSGELLNMTLYAPGGNVISTIPVSIDTGFFGFVAGSTASAAPVAQITFSSQLTNPDASVGQGVGLEAITGAYASSPTLVPAAQIQTTASGLAYSRVTQTFNGTVTLTNVGATSISGPFEVLFTSLPAGVTLVNALGTYNSSPYTVAGVTSLASKQSTTLSVQFSDPSNVKISTVPVTYSGSFN